MWLITWLTGAATEAPVGDPDAGAVVAQTCQACHGPDGLSEQAQWPRLAGQRAGYLTKQLGDFRSGLRADPQMTPMAESLTDQQVVDVVAFFSTRTPAGLHVPPGPPEGARVYLKGRPGVAPCVGCHGARGRGFDGVFDGGVPAIGGQHAAYVQKQLSDFAAGARANDPMPVMRAIAAELTPAEIEAVSAFVAGM
jgi:cytochrome c553